MASFDNHRLAQLMRKRNIRICELACHANGLAPQTLSAILKGWILPGSKRRLAIATGMQHLGFSADEIESVCAVYLPADAD